MRWNSIKCVRKEKNTNILGALIKSYLNNRKLIIEGDKWQLEEEVTCGAPQGSKLGPFLWNIVYDGLLETKWPERTSMVGFADDAIIISGAENPEVLGIRVNESLFRTKMWLPKHGLEMAANKTQAIMVTKKRAYIKPIIMIENEEIQWQRQMTYLGVEIDVGLNFGPHIEKIAKKGLETCARVARMMPNVNGPREKKRRLLAAVATSQILYAAPAWPNAMVIDRNVRRLTSTQRCAAIRVTSAYRTVSSQAVLTLASMPPIDLLVQERADIFERIKGSEEQSEAKKERIRKECRKETLLKWQYRWDTESSGKWTHELIPDLEKWVNRTHGETDFYLTQALTGHGKFNAYLHRFKKLENSECLECGHNSEDARHTLFVCNKWDNNRRVLKTQIKSDITASNLVTLILSSEENWNHIKTYVQNIMKEKGKEENKRL